MVTLAILLGAARADVVHHGTVRLNGPLARPTVGSLQEHAAALTPDGTRVVYMGDLDTEDVVELYVSPADGSGGALRLNGPLVAGGNVRDFQLTPDGSEVVYLADQARDGDLELYAVPIDGSRAPLRLNGRLVTGGDVDAFRIRPDGRWILYRADQLADDVHELFAVPIDRRFPPLRVSGPLVARGDVRDFAFSPDGTSIVYLADQSRDDVVELFSVRGALPPIRLNPPLTVGDVGAFSHGFDFSMDGRRVVYLADQDGSGRVELYSVPVDGSGPPVRLNGPLAYGSVPSSFLVVRDGMHVVYVANESVPGGCEVYAAPIDGSSPATRLGDLRWAFPSTVKVGVDPTCTRVVYMGEGDTHPVPELYSAPLDGSVPAVRLNTALISGEVSEFHIDGGGSRVAFRMQVGFAGQQELYSVPIDGSQPELRLNGALPAGAAVFSPFAVPHGSEHVVYISDELAYGVLELFSVPIDGSAAPVRLSGTLALGAQVHGFQSSDDGSLLLYRADQELQSVDELYAVPADASAPAVRVNDPLRRGPVTGDVGAFALSPDGARVVYAANQDGDDTDGLYSVPIDRSVRPAALHEDFPDGLDTRVVAFAITPDGQQVVHARSNWFDIVGLFAGPLDGSRPTELLAWLDVAPPQASIAVSADSQWTFYSATPPTGFVQGTLLRVDGTTTPRALNSDLLLFDPTSSYAVYRDRSNLPDRRLFSLRLDGTAALARLDGVIDPGRSVDSVAVGADGGTVLYVADQEVDELFELYRVPIDGSAPPTKLSAGAVGGGVSPGLELTSDARHVIYRQESATGFHLFSANVDGSGTPLDLASSAGDVKRLSARGRVVFLDDAGTGGSLRLFSVPADGSAPPTDLSGPLPWGGAISAFDLSVDGAWAVYRADPDVPGQHELFAVPLDGSRPPIRISAALSLGSEVLRHEIAPDSSSVAYVAGDSAFGRTHLFRVPIDGSSAPSRVDDGSNSASAVTEFHFTADSTTILYRADQRQDGVFELFAAAVRHARHGGMPTEDASRTH